MSSELHELIQKEIAAAELRIDAAGSVGQYQRGALRIDNPGRRYNRSGCCDNSCCYRIANWGPLQRTLLRWEALPRGKKIAFFVVLVCIVMMISIATAPAGTADTFGSKDTTPGTLHYVRVHQGLDPEALPSVAIIGVAKAGVTDLFRRLQLRYPSLHSGQYKACTRVNEYLCDREPEGLSETNFLTACQINGSALADYRRISVHCDRVNSGDPLCHDCSPQGYLQMFNTTEIRHSLGACSFPVSQQLACAGGALLPEGDSRTPPAEGYSPVFTIDASKMYAGSVGQALRSADLLKQLSPTTRIVLMLRNPADLGRAIYNAKLAENCGSHECDGRGGTVFVPPYQLLLDREMEFLNKSAHAAHLVERLSASRHPGEARLLEQNLEGNWTQYAVSHGWERELWGKVLYSLKGLYRPVLMTWVDRFVVPGRPLLVIQSEGFFHSAPEVVDSVMGPFLFGDPTGLAAFQKGPPPAPVEKRKYGVKAVQTLASRCALHDLYKPMNVELEKLLREYMKQGKVQVVRARPDGVAGYRAEDGALWPRPGACKVERAPGSNYTANEEDYDYDGASSSEKYSADYDYGYDFTGSDYTDYVEPGTPPQRATPPPRIGRRSLE